MLDDMGTDWWSSLGAKAQVASREDDNGIVTYNFFSGKMIVCDERVNKDFLITLTA